MANYSCDDGYELDGEGIRQCQIDGTWEGEPPSCVEIPTEEPTTEPTTEEPSVEAAGMQYRCESNLNVASNALYGIHVQLQSVCKANP